MAQAVIGEGEGGLRERALAGSEVAFESLIGPQVEPGLRLAFAMLGDRAEAEDCVQEAITKAWRKLAQLRPGRPLRPWFLAIVANQSRNIRRGRWFRTVLVPDPFRRTGEPDPDAGHLDLERAVQRLSPRDRQAIFLHFYLDLPLEEVAAVLGISPPAAKARIYRACRRLRPGVSEEDI
ncbi:MAG TPA: RNA polymerase sigma factor [Candidatus Dormibacteraeota bacterium]|nr:RNA polymerase sigma factor [Candidatus Dormibacteraeota bacterium]